MLLSQVLTTHHSKEGLFEKNLIANISQIVEISTHTNWKGNYIFVRLDSSLGFKVELKFLKNQVLVKGYLLFENGRPVQIPEIYRDSLMKKLKGT